MCVEEAHPVVGPEGQVRETCPWGGSAGRHVPSPVSMSSALPYFGAVRDVVEPCGLSTCMECSEVYVVTSGGAE